jgi:hypothetical protein
VELFQPFNLEIRPVSGEDQKFPIMAFLGGDGGWATAKGGHLPHGHRMLFGDDFVKGSATRLNLGLRSPHPVCPANEGSLLQVAKTNPDQIARIVLEIVGLARNHKSATR